MLLCSLLQLLCQRNFLSAVTLSTLQVFDCTFEKNFFSLSLDYLVGAHVSPSTRGLVISCSFILPHLCTVVITPIIRQVCCCADGTAAAVLIGLLRVDGTAAVLMGLLLC